MGEEALCSDLKHIKFKLVQMVTHTYTTFQQLRERGATDHRPSTTS